jgi:hypothetical protein
VPGSFNYFGVAVRNTPRVCKSNHVECGIENLTRMPAQLRYLSGYAGSVAEGDRVKLAGVPGSAPFVARLEIAAFGELRSGLSYVAWAMVVQMHRHVSPANLAHTASPGVYRRSTVQEGFSQLPRRVPPFGDELVTACLHDL